MYKYFMYVYSMYRGAYTTDGSSLQYTNLKTS